MFNFTREKLFRSTPKIFSSLASLALKPLGSGRTMTLQIDITNACNLSCTHCYHSHHKNKGALKLKDWLLVIEQFNEYIRKYGLNPKVVLCGGEPLASPLLFPLLEIITTQIPQVKISILTNGTLLSEKKVVLFKKFENQLRFQISLDGSSAKLHDFYRGEGNFKRTINGMQNLTKHGLRFGILAVLTQRNSHYIEDFFKLARKYEAPSMNFTRFITEGYGRSLHDSGKDAPLAPIDLKVALQKIQIFSEKYLIKSTAADPLSTILHPAVGVASNYWASVVVSYKGEILLSSRSGHVIGHVLKDGIEKTIHESSIIKKLLKKQIPSCTGCIYLPSCGGDRTAAFASSGSFLGPDPGCWIINQENNKEKNYA